MDRKILVKENSFIDHEGKLLEARYYCTICDFTEKDYLAGFELLGIKVDLYNHHRLIDQAEIAPFTLNHNTIMHYIDFLAYNFVTPAHMKDAANDFISSKCAL